MTPLFDYIDGMSTVTFALACVAVLDVVGGIWFALAIKRAPLIEEDA